MPVGVQTWTSDTAPPIRDVLNGFDSVACVATENDLRPTRWTIHSERVVDETRRLRLSIASVELPDGVAFEQYVLRMPRAAMMVVLNGQGDVLMLWRHRIIIDSWVGGGRGQSQSGSSLDCKPCGARASAGRNGGP